ncbi:uncharacterized protein V1516DRAFT_672171 [Lipomyces oligophaga]|uniref:uncharacterized protein n=1 Tax=Lipomyces oligophaga TaxID=45792 RepID=UPI0034CF1C6F
MSRVLVPLDTEPTPTTSHPNSSDVVDEDAATPSSRKSLNMTPASTAASPSSLSNGGTFNSANDDDKRVLYVGGLDPQLSSDSVRGFFESVGRVESVKIIARSGSGSTSSSTSSSSSSSSSSSPPFALGPNGLPIPHEFNYGFVEFKEHWSALSALAQLNHRTIGNSEIKLNWASYKSTRQSDFHLFVGDLSNEVTDDLLRRAFSQFKSLSEARVMWDLKTGRTRGYGFVSFTDRSEAQSALVAMNGVWLGSKTIRCNWATTPSIGLSTAPFGLQGSSASSFETVAMQSPAWQTTVYVGNISLQTSQAELAQMFGEFGYVVDIRIQKDRGYAFVRMSTHESAALAISRLAGASVHGHIIKCSWGRDRGLPLQSMQAMPTMPVVPALQQLTSNVPFSGSRNGYYGIAEDPRGQARHMYMTDGSASIWRNGNGWNGGMIRGG